jgi:hypothetical protein
MGIDKPYLLINHIKHRIQDKKYENPALAQLITGQVQLGHLFTQLTAYYSFSELTQECNLQRKLLDKQASSFTRYLSPVLENNPTAKITISDPLYYQYNLFMQQFQQPMTSVNSAAEMLEQVKLFAIRSLIGHFSGILAKKRDSLPKKEKFIQLPVVQKKYSTAEKAVITSQLTKITGKEEWKAFNDKGSTVFLSSPFKTKAEAEEIAAQIPATAATIEFKFFNKECVIKLSALSPQKLAASLSDKTVPLEKTPKVEGEFKLTS